MRNFAIVGGGAERQRMEDCYVPSSLVSWVHERVPFVGIGFNNSGRDAEDFVDNLSHGVGGFYDYFLRAVVWGTLVSLLATPLPVVTCVWHCFTARLCSGSGGREGSLGHKINTTVCGALLIGLVLATICVISVGLWAEERFNRGFAGSFDEVRRFLDNASSLSSPIEGSGSGQDSQRPLESLSTFEAASEWVFVTCFTLLFLPLLATLVGLIAAFLCKHPLAMILALIFLMVTSILLILVVGVAVVFLILYSDVCVGLQYKQLHGLTQDCLPELADYTSTLDSFCNEAYLSGVIMVGAMAGIVVGYLCLQLSGSCFAGLYTGYRGSARIAPIDEEEEEEHELQPVWSGPPTPPPDLPLPPETDETDTAVLLSSMDVEPLSQQLSPTTAEAEEFLCSQPENPFPSAPPLTAPAPSPQPEQSSVVEYGDDSVTV